MVHYEEATMNNLHEHMEALEDERRKIEVFQRELPLCLELVNQAIETCKQQMVGTTTHTTSESDWSDQISSDGPVLAEFIPMKRISCDEEENEEQSVKENTNNDKGKSDWLRSVQLWNQSPDPILLEDLPRKLSANEVKGSGVKAPLSGPTVATSSSANATTGKNGGSNKHRRCWSPELHRRFLYALQQLGGSHVATPKQIRELMKVDGLTNDEVKSHLQKYRLHTRRPTPAIHNNSNSSPQQFVLVGGIWMPPAEYATTGIYTQAPALTPATIKLAKLQPEERGSHSEEGGVHSNSPATSSSTHTTTASQLFSKKL